MKSRSPGIRPVKIESWVRGEHVNSSDISLITLSGNPRCQGREERTSNTQVCSVLQRSRPTKETYSLIFGAPMIHTKVQSTARRFHNPCYGRTTVLEPSSTNKITFLRDPRWDFRVNGTTRYPILPGNGFDVETDYWRMTRNPECGFSAETSREDSKWKYQRNQWRCRVVYCTVIDIQIHGVSWIRCRESNKYYRESL